MYNLSDKRPIAIYGTGLDATKCIYSLDKKTWNMIVLLYQMLRKISLGEKGRKLCRY